MEQLLEDLFVEEMRRDADVPDMKYYERIMRTV